MKARFFRKTMILTVITLLAGVPKAFAHGGWGGYGGDRGPMMNYRGGGPMMGPGGYGPGMRGYGYDRPYGLSEEDVAKVAPLREKFLKDTEALRLKINEKAFALRQEMTKATPDEKSATKLQQELSDLRGELGEKALAHRLEVQKVLPDKAFGPGYGRNMGRGAMGRGPGRGAGGYCW